jgi:hypothetical protein
MTRPKLSPRANRLSTISQFENKMKHMLNDFSVEVAGMSDEERENAAALFEEQMDSMRQELHDALANSFSEETGNPDNNAKAYEELLFSAVEDRLQRYMGYYQALTRITQYISDFNNQVGDQALTFKSKDVTDILEKIDEVYVIRHVCTCLLEKADADRIVNHVIDREFARRDLR